MANETTQLLIVVGVDGSEPAKRALRWALEEAKLRGTRLSVVTAWHVPGYAHGAPGFVPILSTSVDAAIREAAEAIANEAVEQARAAGVDAEAIITNGQAADVLIESAEGASMLVVGSRGHGGFAGLLLGSVGQQCAHHAACPVAIIR